MKQLYLTFQFLSICLLSVSQNVGIGTTSPNANARLHVDLQTSNSAGLLVTGQYNPSATVPDLNNGSRLMFYPGKAAFRAGLVTSDQWNNINVGEYSTALGYNSIASGNGSFAAGGSCSATSANSVAFGNTSSASGANSFASGYFSEASGNVSTAIGFNSDAQAPYTLCTGISNIAKAYGCTVIGSYNDSILTVTETGLVNNSPLFIIGNGGNTNSRTNAMIVRRDGRIGIGTNSPSALFHIDLKTNTSDGIIISGTQGSGGSVPNLGPGTRLSFFPGKGAFRAGFVSSNQWDNSNVGTLSTAFGTNTTASGTNSFAAGGVTTASNYYSVAMGYDSEASGFASVALGQYNRASGLGSSALGIFSIAKGYASTAVGTYNDTSLTAISGGITPTSPLFMVGNGDDETHRSNALEVRKNGDVMVQNLQIGGGTVVSKQFSGEYSLGSSATGTKVITLILPIGFSGTPKFICTPKNDPAFGSVTDTFVITIRSITSSQVVLNIFRVDSNTGWSQNLRMDWVAWE